MSYRLNYTPNSLRDRVKAIFNILSNIRLLLDGNKLSDTAAESLLPDVVRRFLKAIHVAGDHSMNVITDTEEVETAVIII